jgi:hypothetical protein
MEEKPELKRSKKFMVSIIACPIITLGLLILLIFLFKSDAEFAAKAFIGSFAGFFCLAFGWLSYLEYTVGKAYYKIFYVPIDKFKIEEYSNFTVLVDSNNFAHRYNEPVMIEKLKKLDKIKVYQYYTLKKEKIRYEIATYEQ